MGIWTDMVLRRLEMRLNGVRRMMNTKTAAEGAERTRRICVRRCRGRPVTGERGWQEAGKGGGQRRQAGGWH